MDRMLLQLKSAPEQDAALEQLLVEQQDPQSANYHRWLTPEEFGAQFGVAQEDLDVIANWLEGHGFRVNGIARGRRSIEFSGTAGQVENAFHTEIHRYLVDGVGHVANATDVAIPDALAGVVGGVASLHDFHARPLHHVVGQPMLPGNPAAGSPAAQTDLSGGSHGLSPYDFATIYDLTPLWTAGYTGAGQTIAVVADTNVKLTDATAFRSLFGLGANNVTVVLNGKDPGVVSGEETEADLDMEWSGGVAKGAAIKLVVSANTNSSDGITLSAQYIVDNNLAPVMSLSYGLCEADMGTANAFYYSLWSQAASQGISVFVATGDSGSAGCDAPQSTGSKGQNTTTPASGGFAVNGLASSPYNVAVGGTEFNEGSGSYWNTANGTNDVSAKSYIPEVVWNESSYTTSGASGNGLWAGGGGYSTLYPTPAWQTGKGVPTVDPVGGGHHRYLPDVSLSAAGHDGYLVYIEGSLYLVGGTSASTPSMAGIMAILVQRAGARQGNPNLKFYPIAAQTPSAYHDITTGTNAVPCLGGAANCSSTKTGTPGVLNGFGAGAGYDLATGWGSVDANALALAWGSAATALTITSLSPNPMTGSSAAQTLTINGSGFASNATVKLTNPSGAVSNPTITLSTSTKITATVNVGATAGTWTVQVVNSATSSSNVVSLPVTVPPVIASLNPNPMTGSSAAQTLTINGAGFQSGLTVNLTTGSSTTTYQGGSITSLAATKVTVSVTVGTKAGAWTVQVVNPGGMTSNTASLTVTAAAPPPAITSLSPNPMKGSASLQTLTIAGSGFQSGAQVLMLPSNGNAVTTYSGSAQVTETATQLKVQVNVGTAKRNWELQVVNPDGQYSAIVLLTVD
jgi:subtilase family serine protease